MTHIIKKYAKPALVIIGISLLAGCSSFSGIGFGKKETNQTYEIMGDAEPAPAGMIDDPEVREGSDRTAQAASFADTGARRSLTSSLGNQGGGYGGPGQTLTVHPGETLWSVTRRLEFSMNFTRTVFDLHQSGSPHDISLNHLAVAGAKRPVMVDLTALFAKDAPHILFATAYDGEGVALVVTDQTFGRYSSLEIFDIQPGKLSTNVALLAKQLGWELKAKRGWENDNFQIHHASPLVVSPDNPRESFIKLLSPYPKKALMDINTKTISVVDRTHSRRNER